MPAVVVESGLPAGQAVPRLPAARGAAGRGTARRHRGGPEGGEVVTGPRPYPRFVAGRQGLVRPVRADRAGTVRRRAGAWPERRLHCGAVRDARQPAWTSRPSSDQRVWKTPGRSIRR